MRKFKHYAFKTVLYSIGAMTAGMIVFTFITIIEKLMI